MYVLNGKLSQTQSLVGKHQAYTVHRAINEWLGDGANSSFSPACDPSVAISGFPSSERGKLIALLSPNASKQAIQWNAQMHPAKSGVRPEDIVIDLARYVDLNSVRAAIQQSSGSYMLNKAMIDAVFVEAVHQFQAKVYFHKNEQDGNLGPSTLDSLGIVKHKLKPPTGNVYGRGVLKPIAAKVNSLTNGEFTANNWFDSIVAPSFLGHRINKFSQGIHILLLRKLREAESYMLALPAYAGMTPVALGHALGLGRDSVFYSGGRISAEPQSLHSFGLALDIDVKGNPWVGAGWITDDKAGRDWLVEQLKTGLDEDKRKKYQRLLNIRNERYRLVETLKLAAQGSLNAIPKGTTIFSFLHSLAVHYGRDTRAAHDFLVHRNEEFKSFLQTHPSELLFWKNSATFDQRDPLNGFLNLYTDLVFSLRQVACLAWGAMDFGPYASGDIMHFDLRTFSVGKAIAERLGAYVPKPGHHPVG